MTVPTRDANDATFYVIRYPEDFAVPAGAVPHPSSPFAARSSPYISPQLLYDSRRGLLELQPEPGTDAAEPAPGLAVDVDGDVYRVDADGVLVVVRCDGTRAPLPCQPGVLAQPVGLALDRRGFLYVADRTARRVVVLLPDHGSVAMILAGGGLVGALVEPIDVAVAPSGLVYVADRGAGRVVLFSAAGRPLTSFDTAAAPGKAAQPIAIMIDAAGDVLVADAWLPRLLRYAPDGQRLGDVELRALTAPLAGGDLARGALARAYGDRVPRFLIGACGSCATPADDGPARLAEVHRALRLLALSLGRRFTTSGIYVSRALDGGRPGVPWHHVDVELDDEPPPGCRVLIETFTDDQLPPAAAPDWAAPRDPAGAALPFTRLRPEQLVQSPPGRYLWLRVTLVSDDGNATPSVRAIRAFYPRVSWLDLLPLAYRRDPDGARFMDRFLALFEHVNTGVEDRFVEFGRQLNLDAAPREIIDWLGALIDLAFDPSWPVERRRALVGEAMSLYRTRGTIAGIERYVEIYTGIRPVIVEGWLERPLRPAFLGRPGAVLGCGLPMLGASASPAAEPDAALWARYAHRFTIFVYVDDDCDVEVTLKAVDRIVEVNKPAHTHHDRQAVRPSARIGVQSRVGLDLVLGDARVPRARLDVGTPGGAAGAGRGGVLGVDTVLGARRPEYVRRLDEPIR